MQRLQRAIGESFSDDYHITFPIIWTVQLSFKISALKHRSRVYTKCSRQSAQVGMPQTAFPCWDWKSDLTWSLKSIVNPARDSPVLKTHGPLRWLLTILPVPTDCSPPIQGPHSGLGTLHSTGWPLCPKLFLLLVQAGFQTSPYLEPPPFSLSSLNPYFSSQHLQLPGLLYSIYLFTVDLSKGREDPQGEGLLCLSAQCPQGSPAMVGSQ